MVGKELHLNIVSSPAIGGRGMAWSVAVNRETHKVNASGLVVTGDAANGSATGTVSFALAKGPGSDPLEQEFFGANASLPASVALNLQWKDGVVGGKYVLKPGTMPSPPARDGGRDLPPPPPNPLSGAAGVVSGKAVGAATPPVPEGRPAMVKPTDDVNYQYASACRLEAWADWWYSELRILALMKDSKLGLSAASSSVLRPAVVRPEMQVAATRSAGAAKAPAAGDLSLDGMDVPEDIAEKQKKTKGGGSDSKILGEMAKEVADIAARVAETSRFALRYNEAADAGTFATGTLTTDDDEFGPWYGEGKLAVSKEYVNALPKAVAEGLPDWPYVRGWKSSGPFPVKAFTNNTPLLPDVVFSRDALFQVDTDAMEMGRYYKGPEPAGWMETAAPHTAYVGAERNFGVLGPPNWSSANRVYKGCAPMLGGYLPHSGLEHTTAFLKAEIESAEEQELWVGIGVNERARMWLNDEPFWVSPADHHDNYAEYVALRKMPFRKGMNRILVRLDVDYSSPFLWMRVCTRGAPRPAEEVKAKAAAVAARRTEARPSGAVGWRGDGNGVYSTKPPLAWNPKSGHNVLWRVPLDYWSNSTPCPVPGSDKVLIAQNLHWLVCLHKDTGKELWRRPVTLLELLPEAEKKEGYRLYDEWWKMRLERDNIPADLLRPEKWWRDSWYWAEGTGMWRPAPKSDERKDANPELLALLDKRQELEKAEDPTAVADELTKVNEQIEKMKSKQAEKDKDSPEARRSEYLAVYERFFAFLQKYCGVTTGAGYWPDYSGFMFHTPVTDGTNVWARANMDVLACYDLDGNVRWMVRTYDASGGDHNMSSPRLVDGKVILQMDPLEGAEDAGGRAFRKENKRTPVLRAFDAATGKVVWTTPRITPPDWNCSTPAVVTLTDGKDVMKVVVTSAGTVVRADDGKILIQDMGLFNAFPSLVATNDIIVFSAPHEVPVRLVMKNRDTVGFQRFWAVEAGFHGNNIGGTVVADGLVLNTGHIRTSGKRYGEEPGLQDIRAAGGPNEGFKGLEVRDMGTGLVTSSFPILRKAGHQYQTPFVAGGHFYSVLGDSIFYGSNPKPPLWVCVATVEPQPLHLANSVIDRTCGTGAVEGDRIYFTGHNFAMCVAYTGDGGKAYEARAIARNLLDQMEPERPKAKATGTVKVTSQSGERLMAPAAYGTPRYVGGIGATLLLNGQAPHSWWAVGPFPAGSEETALQAIGGPAAKVRGDEAVTVGDTKREWGPLSSDWMKPPTGIKTWELDWANFTDIHRVRRVVDLAAATGRREDAVWILATELRSDAEQVMRFDHELPGSRVWVGGKPVQHGDRIAFEKGAFRMIVLLSVAKIPAGGLWLSPRFWTSDDPEREETDWIGFGRRVKPYLERATALAPDSGEAGEARRVLSGL
jgi:outer membrane protein assembly factor BamB